MPFGSYAQREAFGIPGASLVDSGLASHGLLKSPIITSLFKIPSLSGRDQGQQKPAVILPVTPFLTFSLIAFSSSSGLLKILKSKISCWSHITFAVRLIPRVLFTQFTKA